MFVVKKRELAGWRRTGVCSRDDGAV